MTEVDATTVLLISGSTRTASTNTAALRTVAAVAPPGITARLYEWISALPAFNPDDDRYPLPPAVADLRAQIAGADAVLFCTPEYAGTLPGSLKNLLDWTVGGPEMYGQPAAWITVAAEGRGLGAEQTLATVLGYINADIVQPACLRTPVRRDQVDPDGLISDHAIRDTLTGALDAIAEHSANRRADAATAG
ncbi:MAG TPA: NAD(P)H-dependent oxidoreductase [Jatrophihabitantaceae bacterium]|nr:NAD(P)H-dependent oxidoreductase [Jatrophihabitantaceae bacterium]